MSIEAAVRPRMTDIAANGRYKKVERLLARLGPSVGRISNDRFQGGNGRCGKRLSKGQ